MKRLFVLVILVMAALFITACGGGEKADKKAANKPSCIFLWMSRFFFMLIWS